MAAAIFNGLAVKLLKDVLRFKSGHEIITNDTDNPQSVAKSGSPGFLYFRKNTDEIYVKQDSGSSTNWKLLVNEDDFDIIAPTTTKGDLIVHNGTTNIRLPVGTNNHVLTADSAETSGVKWAALPSAGNLSVTSKTANYTATTSDDIIKCDATSGSFIITLPTASGNTGKVFYIIKTDSSLSNAVTIEPDGTETIDGYTNRILTTQHEQLQIVSDGSNWLILERKISSQEVSYTPSFNNLGTTTLDYAYWQRKGNKIIIRMRLQTGTTAASIASVSLPSGLSLDSTVLSNPVSSIGVWAREASDQKFGLMLANITNSSTLLYFGGPENNGAAGGLTRQNGNAVFGNNENVVFNFEVPISGWEG
ncbi:MAG: hypothetical protein FMNOHCHN_03743 [Ignavibacteriaceae bacterium]|nr:hypothetical protein [Ignavibacteriaceae bacterium]